MNRILLVSDSKGYGGVASVTEALVKAFRKNKNRSRVFYLKQGVKNFLRNYFYLVRLYKYYDTFILMHFPAIAMGIFVRLLGFKIYKINVIHTDLVGFYQNSSLLKKMILKCMLYCIRNEKIVFVSYQAEKRAKDFFNFSDTTTIYNIRNVNSLSKSIHLTKKNKSKFILGSIARLHSSKNIDTLIKVFNRLLITNTQLLIELHIYGDGEESDNVKAYAQRHKSSSNIYFMGYEANVENIYSNIDAVVSFSTIEGFGLSILESFDYGKPVFHTACPSGPTELLLPSQKDIIYQNDEYIHTCYGFLVNSEKSRDKYSIELTEQQVKYVDLLHKFIEFYKENEIKAYDFSKFDSSYVVEQWIKLIKGD
ncbi:glycosyltransferase [Wohlfahrtiimonas chitiniclastica]|uniref:glycosyltransferase n=1 Tax=Wohlfahrtiimonas chitiniclastica TaxID=400946 RepID=UPI001BCFB6FE|nr:glycosyltransferase [Wohlfahrtiimonas chitiniclastica]MBS7836627.1 glycosyltransferase [Wohlfahrtiimonas chitiniclastica]